MKQKSSASGNTSRREMVDKDQSFLHKFDCLSEVFSFLHNKICKANFGFRNCSGDTVYTATVDDKRIVSNKNKVNLANLAKKVKKLHLPHEMAKIGCLEMARF